MRIAINQPNYLPWRGYFDFFKQSNLFVFYDDVQYTRQDWRNRNIIKTPDGPGWLQIPVEDYPKNANINEIKVRDNGWKIRHVEILRQNYMHAPYYGEVMGIVEDAFSADTKKLSDLDILLTKKMLEYIGISRQIVLSSDVGFAELSRTDRLVAICKKLGGTEYITGEAAKDYLEPEKFGDIRVLWHKYKEKVYPQLWGDFLSRVSILDTLFNLGPKTYDVI